MPCEKNQNHAEYFISTLPQQIYPKTIFFIDAKVRWPTVSMSACSIN
jgi:hypothetical protein